MKYVLDFDGAHQSNNMVNQLIGGEVYQPVDLSEVTDDEFLEVLDYLETINLPENDIYVFTPHVGFTGEYAGAIYQFIRDNVVVKSFIAKGF